MQCDDPLEWKREARSILSQIKAKFFNRPWHALMSWLSAKVLLWDIHTANITTRWHFWFFWNTAEHCVWLHAERPDWEGNRSNLKQTNPQPAEKRRDKSFGRERKESQQKVWEWTRNLQHLWYRYSKGRTSRNGNFYRTTWKGKRKF